MKNEVIGNRDPDTQAKYDALMKARKGTGVCPFCNIESSPNEDIVKMTEHFFVLRPIAPYVRWDDRQIDNSGGDGHLMIVPKRHILCLGEMNEEERVEYISLQIWGERHGFSSYIRSPDNPARSVPHLHAHLLRVGEKLPAT